MFVVPLCGGHRAGEAQEDVLQGDPADRVLIQHILFLGLLQGAKELWEGEASVDNWPREGRGGSRG